MVTVASSCCSWNFDSNDFNFNVAELKHFDPYKTGDTIYFINSSGNQEAITITEIDEEKEKGSTCMVSFPPYHIRSIHIKHLPEDKWHGTTYFEGETKEINYQPLLSISKFPVKKNTVYTLSFQGFVFVDTAFGKPGTVHLTNGIIIYNCYTFKHSYPERIKDLADIERIYWTDQYGLTAYTNNNGDAWLIRDFQSQPGLSKRTRAK
jgi:hypothetical protein